MTDDRTEQLVRDAFAEEAARAVDSREVLAAVRGKRPRRSYGLVLATAAVVVIVAAVAAFVVPEVFQRSSVPPATEQSRAVTPTNVLVIGMDGRGRSDSVMLVQVVADGSVNVVSLPRDSWVSVDGKMTRLSQIYTQSNMDTLLRTVSDLTGVQVDHLIVIDTKAVVDLTNAVGGVPVCLNAATSDQLSGADFPAGPQVLNGDQALAFIRQRHGLPNSDLDRIVRLQAFMQSAVVKLRNADLAAVIAATSGRSDIDPNLDLLGLATDLVQAKELHIGTIPIANPDLQTPEGAFVLGVDPAQVQEYVSGLPNTPPATGNVPCVN
jgi:LCP family protein required for cell wall assembly